METAIRFSQNSPPDSHEQRFIKADVTNKSFKLCRTDRLNTKGASVVEYDEIATSVKVPPFRAFDWHPHPDHENLIAVGQSGGEATLLSLVKPGEPDPGALSFQVRSQRSCNAVSLSSNHLLAAGLDRVRTDFCLNIWDFSQRLPSSSASVTSPKSPNTLKGTPEPLHKLAPGDGITSLKFFPTSPLHLVAGSKSQWVRLYDLREASTVSNTGLQFNTRCVHNLAIDPRDENYIASCYPTSGDSSVALWDRRMMARGTVASSSYPMHEGRQPEPSLELKNVVDSPGSIWSMRFSKSKRGCLGVLSSSGQLKVYELGKDNVVEEYKAMEDNESKWEVQLPQEVFLDRSQDIERATTGTKVDKSRVVSFDFTTSQDARGQPSLIIMTGNGEIRTTATSAVPEPTTFHSAGFIMHGKKYFQGKSNSSLDSFLEEIKSIKSKAQPHNTRRQAYAESKSKGQAAMDKISSFESQAWQADLGFYETSTNLPELVSLTSIAKVRCENGYMLDPASNKKITSDNKWLSGFWSWCSWAQQLNKSSALTQDNLDLSYLGVYSIWMEDLPPSALAVRNFGPSQYPANTRLSKTIEALVRRLQLPASRHVATEYHFNRQLCLYISNLAWATSELDTWTASLASSNQHAKAAFLALISGHRDLAIRSLKAKGSTQTHHFIALAISTSSTRKAPHVSTQDQSNLDSDDESTSDSGHIGDDALRLSLLSDTLSTLTEPFARAILTYLKTTSWSVVLDTEPSLPMRYRLAIALRHLSDKALTSWISSQTTAALIAGDLEGVYLVGTGSGPQSLDLLQTYAARFNDLQTAVCALATTTPRYIRDTPLRRRYDAMRETYRAEIMAWGGDAMFDRVAFDVACTRAAAAGSGRGGANANANGNNGNGNGNGNGHGNGNKNPSSLIKPPPPQVRLICSHCAGGLAHHEESSVADDSGAAGDEIHKHAADRKLGSSSGTTTPAAATNNANNNGNGHNGTVTGNAPSAATAAALGTVCPRCGRKMSRCGVCDGYLGQEDASFMKWYGRGGGADAKTAGAGSVDASAAGSFAGAGAAGEKMAGSVSTIVGPEDRDKMREKHGSAGSKTSTSVVGAGGRGVPVVMIQAQDNAGAVAEEAVLDAEAPPDEDADDIETQIERLHERDRLMARFTVVCVKCGHAFHHAHARQWFEGDIENGTVPHRMCPVPKCACFCWED